MKIIEFLFSLIFATLQFSTTIQKAEAQIFDHLKKKSEILCLVKVDDDKKVCKFAKSIKILYWSKIVFGKIGLFFLEKKKNCR